MAFISGHDKRVTALLEAMGLPVNHLRRVTIDMAVGDAVTITTYGFTTTDDMEHMTEFMREYRLIEKVQEDEPS